MDLGYFVVGFLALIISVCIHEAAHALVANWLGDPTGKHLGRITLNPVPHIDLFYTIILPIVLLITTKGSFVFGGAKPVPVNHFNFKNPPVGMAVSAAAGPISNFLLAILGGLILIVLVKLNIIDPLTYNFKFLVVFVMTNVTLGVFNLLPIPPLDGSRVFRLILPANIRESFDQLERFGLFIVMGVMLLDQNNIIGTFSYNLTISLLVFMAGLL